MFSCISESTAVQESLVIWTPITFGALVEISRMIGFRPTLSFIFSMPSVITPDRISSVTIFVIVILAKFVISVSCTRVIPLLVQISFKISPLL